MGKTCGSLLAALDMHLRVATQILRHSKTAITMEIYTDAPSAATREALRKLRQWLDEVDTQSLRAFLLQFLLHEHENGPSRMLLEGRFAW
jgi:hypothetical protein